jgi:aspartate kinase
MALIVQKYGGTSVGSVERIEAVADRIAKNHATGDQLIVVVSAMSGETNRLLGLASDLTPNPSPRELDVLVSTGEQVSMALLSMALHARGIPALSLKGSQVAIRTDSSHNKARIQSIDDRRLRSEMAAGKVVVVAGFQGVDENGETTTLGRGGSDTSAVALAAAIKADECQIYTDVDGVYTTDPRVVDGARRLESITFEEMLEMASMGSKVLQLRSVEFAGKYSVPLRVLRRVRGLSSQWTRTMLWKRQPLRVSHLTEMKRS